MVAAVSFNEPVQSHSATEWPILHVSSRPYRDNLQQPAYRRNPNHAVRWICPVHLREHRYQSLEKPGQHQRRRSARRILSAAPDCIGRSALAFSCCLTGRNDASGLLIQSFTAQPETPASTKAGTSDWAVNSSPPDATKSTVLKPPATCVTKTGKHRRARALTLQN